MRLVVHEFHGGVIGMSRDISSNLYRELNMLGSEIYDRRSYVTPRRKETQRKPTAQAGPHQPQARRSMND